MADQALPQAIALATRMSLQELDLLAIVIGALARDARSKRQAVDKEVAKVGGPAWRKTVADTVLVENHPGLVVKAMRGMKRRRPRIMKRRTYVPREGTAGAKVWEALQQSSGELTAQDLTVLLDLPSQKVSHALYELTKKKSTIKVTKVKVAQDDGTVRRVYKYLYTGKARAA